jgi:hypothetical protein
MLYRTKIFNIHYSFTHSYVKDHVDIVNLLHLYYVLQQRQNYSNLIYFPFPDVVTNSNKHHIVSHIILTNLVVTNFLKLVKSRRRIESRHGLEVLVLTTVSNRHHSLTSLYFTTLIIAPQFSLSNCHFSLDTNPVFTLLHYVSRVISAYLMKHRFPLTLPLSTNKL